MGRAEEEASGRGAAPRRVPARADDDVEERGEDVPGDVDTAPVAGHARVLEGAPRVGPPPRRPRSPVRSRVGPPVAEAPAGVRRGSGTSRKRARRIAAGGPPEEPGRAGPPLRVRGQGPPRRVGRVVRAHG